MLNHDLIINLLAAILCGYLLGSIPFAQLAARLRGVDIFTTGNMMAGAANVFWHIGRRTGALVFAGDVAKGSAAVLIAGMLDVPAPGILLAAGAAIFGHWKSPFAGFKGGDGMATLIGISVTLEPALATAGIVLGLVAVLALWRAPLRSAWALFCGFTVMLGFSQYYQIDRELVMGLSALAMLVLFHSLVVKWRRAHSSDGEDLEVDQEQASDLGPPTRENP